jgi:hypothetical protein
VDISRFKTKTVLAPSDAARTTVRIRRGRGETREMETENYKKWGKRLLCRESNPSRPAPYIN